MPPQPQGKQQTRIQEKQKELQKLDKERNNQDAGPSKEVDGKSPKKGEDEQEYYDEEEDEN